MLKKNMLRNYDNIKPTSLRGLEQAFFILEHLCEGDLEDDIISDFDGDSQLVTMWLSFLKHSHWVTFDTVENRWAMTARSKQWALV